MQTRVDGTNVGQSWRVKGRRADDEDRLPGAPAVVQLEFWLEDQNYYVSPISFDPELARRLGEQLIEMADHAQNPGA